MRAYIVVVICLAGILRDAPAQGVRPIRDDVGFCWTTGEMDRLVSVLADGNSDPVPPGPFVAAVSPHDDYLYAGRVYDPLFRKLRTREAVIFGVTHGAVRKEIGDPQGILLLESFDAWKGPLGPVRPSPLREWIRRRMDSRMVSVNNRAHELEHSIEALVPFLQYFNPGVVITPIMVTAMDTARMDSVSEALAGVIADYLRENHLTPGRDIVFLMSSDANHYGKDFNNTPYGDDANAHAAAVTNDRRIAASWLTVRAEPSTIRGLSAELQKVVWCGRYSVPFGMFTTYKVMQKTAGKSIRGSLLRYSDTFSEGVLPVKGTTLGLTAPFSLKHWVGFLSAGFVLE